MNDKIDGVGKKNPDISGLATKTSLNDYLKTSTFNSKVTEVENKIKAADIIGKSANTKANTIRSDLTADVATDIIRWDHLVLVLKIYQNGNQLVFTMD